MNRLIYLAIFLVAVLALALGLVFLCAATTEPSRLAVAVVLLLLGALGAGWSAYAYRTWSLVQPAALSARITDLAARNDGELSLAQVMSAFGVPASIAQAGMDELLNKGQCQREPRGADIVYIFPGLKEHKVVRKCVYCGSTFPVKQPLQKCPNCGGNLELVNT